MISDPNLIRYACVAHQSGGSGGVLSTILAEYNPEDSSFQALAKECILRTPPNHSIFSHTVKTCAYTFLIEDPLVYFAIFHDQLPKFDRLWFLNRFKDASMPLIGKHSKSIFKCSKSFTSFCLQNQLDPIFRKLVMSNNGVGVIAGSNSGDNRSKTNEDDHHDARGGCRGQSIGRRMFAVPLLGEGKKKKTKLARESGGGSKGMLVESKAEFSDQDEVTSREILVCNQMGVSGGVGGGVFSSRDVASGGRQKAKKIWRRHVWVVLVLDLAVCLILFGVWLVVCHGFQCIDE